jgi:hypothetical protein
MIVCFSLMQQRKMPGFPSTASWTWKSFMSCRNSVFTEARWQVVSGQDIALHSKWPQFKMNFQRKPSECIVVARDLMDAETCLWNPVLVKRLCPTRNAVDILNQLIFFSGDSDRLIWQFSHSGNYTVKRG